MVGRGSRVGGEGVMDVIDIWHLSLISPKIGLLEPFLMGTSNEDDDSLRRQRKGLRYLNCLADGLRIERR